MNVSQRVIRVSVLVAALAVVGLIAWGDGHRDMFFLDTPYFFFQGRILFSARWLQLFSDPELQVGPLHVLAFAVFDKVGFFLNINPAHIGAVAIEVGLTAALVVTARIVQPLKDRIWPDVAVIVAAVALGLTWNAFATGHFSEGLIPLLWVGAARAAARERPLRAGLLVALGLGLKTWAIFGVIGLLLSPNWRVAARGAAAAVVGSLIIYGPFFLFGEVNTFDFHWIVHRDVGPIAPFVTVGEAFGWGGRLFQGLFVVAMGLLSVWWLRPRTTHATWAVPLMLVLARVWTDPVGIPYYWVPVQALTIVGIVAVIKWKLELWRLLLIACLWLLLWPSATWTPVLGVVICALLVKLPADEVLPADDQPNAKEGDVEVPGSPLPPVTTEV